MFVFFNAFFYNLRMITSTMNDYITTYIGKDLDSPLLNNSSPIEDDITVKGGDSDPTADDTARLLRN